MEQLDGNPVLDEADYSSREDDAALENIEDAARRLKPTYDLRDRREAEVDEWLSAHAPVPLKSQSEPAVL